MLDKAAIIELAGKIREARNELLWAQFIHGQLITKARTEGAPVNEFGDLVLENASRPLSTTTPTSTAITTGTGATMTPVSEKDLTPEQRALVNQTFPSGTP